MAQVEYQRLVLLNRMVSRSASRAPQEHHPPVHSALELMLILEKRRAAGIAIEYLGSTDDKDEEIRASKGEGHDLLRLSRAHFEQGSDARYITLLIEHIDQRVTSFPVVHTKTFDGRDISGDEDERGASSVHVVIRLPKEGAYDDGNYRCAIESMSSGVTRKQIELFLTRQLRRACPDWTFSATVHKRGRKPKTTEYRYYPRLELFADVGRKLGEFVSEGRTLTHMVFTKRSEKESIGQPTAILHEDVIADIEYRISAKQAPADPGEKRTWIENVKQSFELRGFESRLYYRHASGTAMGGGIHQDIAGATDLLICPKEIISLMDQPKRWRNTICPEIVGQMKALLDRNALWERSK
jgi:hypothetical protein